MIMKRTSILSLVAVLVACGGGEPADEAPASAPAAAPAQSAAPAMGEMSMPEWFQMDEANQTVHLTITAGLTDAKNYWNFNGATDGKMAITVPAGYSVTIDFVNNDPNMAHSLGVVAAMSGTPSATPSPEPVFAGAVTSNPTSMMDGTMPGQSETIMFTADTAGEYSLLCFVPGHAATGMWIHFNVSSDGTAGVQSAM